MRGADARGPDGGLPRVIYARAPAAPGIGTQHLEIPRSIPVDAQDETRGVGNRESTGIGHA